MKKIILGGVAGILILGFCGAAVWWKSRPQVIQLDKNTKLTLLGVQYGKHHAAPKIAGQRARGGNARLDTTNDTLVVWVEAEHKPNQWPNFNLLVSDTADTACVSAWSQMNTQLKNGVEIMGFTLNAYPRWDRKFILRARSWNGNQHVSKDQFVVANPVRKSIPKWTAETMPDTQSDGDLSVTLTKFVFGVRGFNGGNGPSNDPANKAVHVEFHVEQNGSVATNWQPIHLTTSDASGNEATLNSWSNTRDRNSGDATMTYQWGLWPEQTPWKLRVEFSRDSGFADGEIWSVTNVLVKPGTWQDMWGENYGGRNSRTNAAVAETTINGFHLKLFPVFQFTDQNRGNNEKPGGFRVQSDEPLDGMQFTLLKATDENGRNIQSWSGNGWGGNSRQFQIQNLRNAASLNITLALHKSRFIEFTVNPTKQ